MGEIKQAWDVVFGEGASEEMATRLYIVFGVLIAVVLLIIVIAIWRAAAGSKIKKAVLKLSEHPNDEHAELFIGSVGAVSFIGRYLNKHSKGFAGLSKGECRSIYNSTVLASANISDDNKKKVRDYLMKLGCSGLTDR